MSRSEIERARGAPAFVGSHRLPSVLGSDSPITGKLSFSSPTRIDGALRGEVRSTALLVIGEKGSVNGTLRASELIILGEVRGDVQGARRVEIGASGRLHGRVEAQTLIVQAGGILQAECSIGREEEAHAKLAKAPR